MNEQPIPELPRNRRLTFLVVIGFLLGSGALTGTSLLIFHLVVK